MPPEASTAPAAAPTSPTLLAIPHNRLHLSPHNPRRAYAADPLPPDLKADLAELAASIAQDGVVQSLLVRAHPTKKGEFEIMNGERRWRAMALNIKSGKAAADTPMPAQLRVASDLDLLRLAMVENIQRESLTPMEEAAAFKRMVEGKMGTDRIAELVGKTRRYVQQRLDLLDRLHPAAQKALGDGKITVTQARLLTQAPHDRQADVLKEIVPGNGGMRRLETEDEIARAVRATLIPVAAAWFDPKLYTGKLEPHPDGSGDLCCMDVGQFERLQKEFMDGKKAELKKKWKWVETVEHHDLNLTYAFERAKTGDGKAGAVIVISRPRYDDPKRDFKVFEGVIEKDNPARGGHNPRAASAPKKGEDKFDPRAFAEYCNTVRIAAFRAAIAGDELFGLRLLALNLTLGSGSVASAVEVNRYLSTASGNAGDRLTKEINTRLGNVDRSNVLKLWGRLCLFPKAHLVGLLALAAAAHATIGRDGEGDDRIDLAIARDAKPDLAQAWNWPDFLKLCGPKQLARLGIELGLGKSTDVKALRAALAKMKPPAGYVPLWLRFLAADEIEKALAAPAADKAAALPAKAKAEKQAKKPAAKKKGK